MWWVGGGGELGVESKRLGGLRWFEAEKKENEKERVRQRGNG